MGEQGNVRFDFALVNPSGRFQLQPYFQAARMLLALATKSIKLKVPSRQANTDFVEMMPHSLATDR